jgi:hypothetical protein
MDRSLCVRRSTHAVLARDQARLTHKVQCAKPLPHRGGLLGFVKRHAGCPRCLMPAEARQRGGEDPRAASNTPADHAGPPSPAMQSSRSAGSTRTSPPPLTRRPLAQETRPTTAQPALGRPGGLRPSVGGPWAMTVAIIRSRPWRQCGHCSISMPVKCFMSAGVDSMGLRAGDASCRMVRQHPRLLEQSRLPRRVWRCWRKQENQLE